MKKYSYCSILLLLPSAVALAQHDDDHRDPPEEIVVTSPLMRQSSETIMPTNIIAGETLREHAASTLGDTLKHQLGVHSSAFGPGVGLPIIRGQSGNRVRILEDSNGTPDVSAISQDHAISVEPLLAERIEIIRGPSTLLYGNGAIGGVINIIDNRIPDTIPNETHGAFELRHHTASNGKAGVFKLTGGSNNIAWHLNGVLRNSDDVKIPGFAIDEAAVEAQTHVGNEEADDSPIKNTYGYIANSDTQAQSFTAGFSQTDGQKFFGASVNRLETEYGIPAGSHNHHEDEQTASADSNTHINMKQARFDFKLRQTFNHFLEKIEFHGSLSDYQHKEIEGVEIGTLFHNKSEEGRLTLNHSEATLLNGDLSDISGIIGIHINNRSFSAIGEESFIPASDIITTGIFIVENLTINDWVYEFGIRHDQQTVKSSTSCQVDNRTLSTSLGTIWNFSEEANLVFAINHSERSATVEELFSNIDQNTCTESNDSEQLVLHTATSRYEIGNPNLTTETANNFEIGLRKHLGSVRSEINYYRNLIDDYIFLADTEVFLHESFISRYQQRDAIFTGIELEITFPFSLANKRHLDVTLMSDFVRAEFNNGRYVPRIPAKRLGIELAYSHENWSTKLHVTFVGKQNNIAEHEQTTPSYASLDLRYDYHRNYKNNELVLFISGTNLLNEEIRNHTSFLKNISPAAGRSIETGARYYF